MANSLSWKYSIEEDSLRNDQWKRSAKEDAFCP